MITTDHIHLDVYVPSGPQPLDYKYNSVRDIRPTPTIIGSYGRTLTGAPISHVLKIGGAVARFFDYQYELRMTVEEFETMQTTLYGEVCILVDVRHCADVEDHTPYYKKVWFSDLRFIKVLSPELGDILVSASFVDFYTVSPL